MTRIPTTDEAFARWMQQVEDRLDRLERGQQLRGQTSFDQRIVIGDVTIHADSHSGSMSTDLVATRKGGTSVIIATLT